MNPQEILDQVRDVICDYAEDDPDKWFYANRFVFARLQLDERKTKTEVKKQLFEKNPACHYCNESIKIKAGIHLHRLDGDKGYSLDNCVLMHPDCHTTYHKENPTGKRKGWPRNGNSESSNPILEKKSKRYESGPFIYWWDISPGFSDKIDGYESIDFIKRDTGERCCVPTVALKGYLTEERQTTRGNGNWGIKVLKDKEGKLAFEPGKKDDKWLSLPVVWLNDTQED